MKALIFLLLTPAWSAPVSDNDDDLKLHNHTGPYRSGKYFSSNEFVMGNIDVDGNVSGEQVSIGHDLGINIDHGKDLTGAAVIDGGWSGWSVSSECSASCGAATRKWARTCTNPAPANEGKACEGNNEETRSCDRPLCGIYDNVTNKNMRAIGELQELIDTIADDMKQLANGRERRGLDHGLAGFELELHDLLTASIEVLGGCVSKKRWICSASKIEDESNQIKLTFGKIKATGTVTPLLVRHFGRLKKKLDDAIQMAEKVLMSEEEKSNLEDFLLSISLCPIGFEAISQKLDGADKDGADKVWTQPHTLATRTIDDCAAICIERSGCTSFEFSEGESEHGACGTYTGGDDNIRGSDNRLSGNSNWRSCMRAIHGDWSSWSQCSQTCKDGALQSRTCTNPKPQYGGDGCSGSTSQMCNQHIPCPVPNRTHRNKKFYYASTPNRNPKEASSFFDLRTRLRDSEKLL